MTCGNILLVDDDPGFLTALTKTLVKHDYTVTDANSAAAALAAIQNQKQAFDVVITDLSMPMISGMAVLNAVKAAFPAVQVIVITAFGDQLTKTNALRDGAFAFIHKPLDSVGFLGLVERAVTAGQQQNRPNETCEQS